MRDDGKHAPSGRLNAPKKPADRDVTHAIVDQHPRNGYGWCAFCGRPCRGYACSAHLDLPQLDRRFSDDPTPLSLGSEGAGSPTDGG